MLRAIPRQNKFGAQKVVRDGIQFDSQKECRRWYELKMLERAGEIKDLQRQVTFDLIPSQFEGEGKKRKCIERAVSYIADFVYLDKSGHQHVEDTKGLRTKEYIIKRKLMLFRHGIRIEEI